MESDGEKWPRLPPHHTDAVVSHRQAVARAPGPADSDVALNECLADA